MAIREIQVTRFVASDGITYETREQAERAEFVSWACRKLQLSTQMTPAEVLTEIFDYRGEVVMVLESVSRVLSNSSDAEELKPCRRT
jgi:hypothetical protein